MAGGTFVNALCCSSAWRPEQEAGAVALKVSTQDGTAGLRNLSRLRQLKGVHHVLLRQAKHANKATPPGPRAGKPCKERIQRR